MPALRGTGRREAAESLSHGCDGGPGLRAVQDHVDQLGVQGGARKCLGSGCILGGRVWRAEEGLGSGTGWEATEAPPVSPGCAEAEPRGQRGPEFLVRTQSGVSGRWVWRGAGGRTGPGGALSQQGSH